MNGSKRKGLVAVIGTNGTSTSRSDARTPGPRSYGALAGSNALGGARAWTNADALRS